MTVNKIPARYIGEHEVLLPYERGPYFDGNGHPLQPSIMNASTGEKVLGLHYGDTIMMPDVEVLGQTYLINQQTGKALHLGAGRKILKEHQGKSLEELVAMGYEFQEGRKDFAPLEMSVAALPIQQIPQPVTPVEAVEAPVDPVEAMMTSGSGSESGEV